MLRAKLWIIVAMVVSLLPAAVASQSATGPSVEPNPGLLWQNTGLPAVFPLQVKTQVGRNYYLQLKQVDTEEPALAAFINGGEFFKVLVPPGRFTVTVFAGRDWQGEEALFGPGKLTEIIELAEPLTFGVRGFSTKVGHLIDLTKHANDKFAEVRLKPQLICQTYGIAPMQRHIVVQDGLSTHRDKAGHVTWPNEHRSHWNRVNFIARQFGHSRTQLKFVVRSRVC